MLLAYPLTSVDRIRLIQARHPKAASVEHILKMYRVLRISKHGGFENSPSIAHQLNVALELAALHNEILVVCGSIFIMSDVRQMLGYNYPIDSKYIFE